MEAEKTPPAIVPLEAFTSCDFETPVAGLKSAELQFFALAYQQAAATAEAEGRGDDVQVFAFLDAICGMHLNPDDKANVWVPRGSGIGWRGPIPTDFKGKQSEILLELIESIKNPALKARLADVVWTNDRKTSKAAVHAVNAYCECAELITDKYTSEDASVTYDVYRLVKRGLQIAQATSKKGNLPENIRNTLKKLYDHAKSRAAYVVLRKTAELGLYYELFDPAIIAAEVEAIATAASEKANPVAVMEVFNLGVYLYAKLQNEEGKKRCQIGEVNQALAMRSHVNGAGAEAAWVMEALQKLKHIQGMEEKEEELERDLRRLQKASLRQMVAIPLNVDFREENERVTEIFEKYDLSAALFNFALLDQARPVEDLRQEALQTLKTSPLMATISVGHVDNEGRTVAKTAGADFDKEPSEEWFLLQINKSESLRRYFTVAGRIDPARITMSKHFIITEEHIMAIIGYSGFVPHSQKPIMALGIVRFLQGDFMSATHLLLPQIEPCLRYILKINGHDPSKRFSDSTEEDLSLGGLITRMRTELEQILTQPILSEIELLFDKRPGPQLRHEIAHGQIGAGKCFQPDVIYACWLIYRLCCLFVLSNWEKFIQPALNAL